MRFSIVLVIALAACATVEPAPTKPFTLGLAQPVSAEQAHNSERLLNEYFAQALPAGSHARVYDTAAELADALASGAVDAAWLTAGAYVRATGEGKAFRPVLKLSRGGVTTYRSAFFTLAGTGTTLALYRGKRLALVAEGSISGRLVPLAHLKRMHVDPQTFFSEIIDAKDHKGVCELVLTGKADLGATLSEEHGTPIATADGCREAGMDEKRFAVLAVGGLVPNDVIAVRSSMSEDEQKQLEHIFAQLSAGDAGKAHMLDVFQADAFAPAADDDFAELRALVAEAK